MVEAAVWPIPGEVEYQHEAGDEGSANVRDGGGRFARALTLNTLLAETPRVDSVKMDIEGAEARVLRENTEWLAPVQFNQGGGSRLVFSGRLHHGS